MASANYNFSRMLDPSNMLRFECPVFHTEVEARVCFKLHDAYMRGQPHAKRPGCSACMSAGKCPAPHMVKEVVRSGTELYYSAEPKVGKLSRWLLERTVSVKVLEKTMRHYGCSPAEEAAIEAAVIPADEFRKSQASGTKKRGAMSMAKLEDADATPIADATVEAAKKGDLAAALTKAAKPEPPPEKPAAIPLPTRKPAAAPTGTSAMSLLELARQKKAS